MNTWRWVSSEFGYHIQRGKYRLEQVDIPGDIDENLGYETYRVGLATRQFEYTCWCMHARANPDGGLTSPLDPRCS